MSETPPSTKPTYGSAIRVAQILHWLHQFPLGMSLKELCRRLDVSERTLHRYIQTLKEAFFDDEGEPLIEVARNEAGGRLRFRRKGVQIKGTAYELMSLYLALDMMAFLEGTFIKEGAQEVLDRMQKTLLRDHGHETNLVLKDFDRKFFQLNEAPKEYHEQNQLLDRIVQALVKQRVIEILYASPNKEPRTHRLSPLSLLMYKRALYLIGRKEDGERTLTFAVERIREVTMTSETFFYPTDYDPSKRFKTTFGMVQDREPEMIRLLFDKTVAQNVVSRRWHHTQDDFSREDGSVEITMETETGLEFQAWLLGYGEYVSVLEPESLKETMGRRLRAALETYA